ncbi:hypothetical protein COCMIDRAFT_1783 [Bipolaris oryzae ATCC 44560]|uniref:Carbohydrate-binding module family 18 protein n=1 Tax=Bipolaris oryzae ATCC 44560 TaxID=930090 RepID=W6ZHS3_COCMI|nr:uncharacterized protein COCMIDRAFT_1783 [Bipolaris oryzae ATCC 44560]EUC49540.1 hypothetical protein COCMIDRAFT_1783 [Bipolaris oryzae ATCC 44560]
MKFATQLFTVAALLGATLAAPAADSNMIEVRDALTNEVMEGMAIDKRQVCYCYGGFCTPGCHGKVKRQVCYCYGGVCTPGCH